MTSDEKKAPGIKQRRRANLAFAQSSMPNAECRWISTIIRRMSGRDQAVAALVPLPFFVGAFPSGAALAAATIAFSRRVSRLRLRAAAFL